MEVRDSPPGAVTQTDEGGTPQASKGRDKVRHLRDKGRHRSGQASDPCRPGTFQNWPLV